MAHRDERLRGGTRTEPPPGGPASKAALRPALRERRPRATAAWVWTVVGLGALMTGIAVGHGLLIAAGLVAAGVGGQLFDPGNRRGRRPGHRTAA
ncbi:hypothetical protein ABZ252_30665 [Streptomyces sp. NPDC006175]|uniref:hypothetical protein n=1 Tax=Streptomyces sp. NPDC006175 TaxID=3154471 RepID=UPI0033B2BE00